MIPMSCPSCGRRGNVPLDRLNTRMHCKKCDAIFYLDATGKPVVGEPPSAKNKGGKSGGQRDKNEPTDYVGLLFTQLAKLPKPFWLTLAVGLAGYGLFVVATTFFKSEPLSASEIYSRHAVEVGRAFLNKDSSAIKYMASPGTEEALVKWVEVHRADLGDGKTSSEGIQVIPGIPPAIMNDTNPAGTELVFILPSDGSRTTTPSFNLRVYWLYINGQVMVEGKKTLEAAEEAAAAAKKK